MNPELHDEAGRKPRPTTLLSLFVLCYGVFAVSALMRYHVVLETDASSANPLVGPALLVSSLLGFAGATFLFLLVTVWAGIVFVTGEAQGVLRRLGLALVFAFCLGSLAAAFGHDGGQLGGSVARRLAWLFGPAFSGFLLSALTLLSFLLATDWLFFRSFLRLAGRVAPEAGLEAGEELGLQGALAGPVLRPASAAALAQERSEEARLERPVRIQSSVAEPPIGRRTRLSARPATVVASSQGGGTGTATVEEDRSVERRRRLRAARQRKDQDVLDSILDQLRQDLDPEPTRAPKLFPGDPIADLDDEELLAKAGEALDEILGEGVVLPAEIRDAARSASSEPDRDAGTGRGSPAEAEERTEPAAPEERAGLGEAAEPEECTEQTESSEALSELDRIEPVEPVEPAEPAEPVELQEPSSGTAGEAGDPVRDEAEPVELAPDPRAADTEPEDQDQGEDEDEPTFILEPAPTMRIYRDRRGDEDLHQENLFAEDPPEPELLDRAARIVLTSRRPTPTLLQRRLGLSFAESRQLLSYLVQLGALGEPVGAGPFEPRIDLVEWEARRA